VFDVNTGKAVLQVKTGHLPGRISFVGENRVATVDTLLLKSCQSMSLALSWICTAIFPLHPEPPSQGHRRGSMA
jgi:hypothetical protein